jgi:hypothetical protein
MVFFFVHSIFFLGLVLVVEIVKRTNKKKLEYLLKKKNKEIKIRKKFQNNDEISKQKEFLEDGNSNKKSFFPCLPEEEDFSFSPSSYMSYVILPLKTLQLFIPFQKVKNKIKCYFFFLIFFIILYISFFFISKF